MTLVQKEPKAIKIGIPHDDYSAMQGPCPSGFHVPLNTEWQTVYNIWTALGGGSSDGTNFGIALKLPFAGRRLYSSAGVDNQGASGSYRSSSRYNADNAYSLYFYSSAIYPQINSRRAFGFSVRCFKNSPVVPTSSWTKLYGTSIEAGGIFWNSTDGLISLSSDGNTWITIADKNLGATTVWNSGDALSEANCGKYYQRGNNYGFPRTGSVTTSSTQVNASTYGPGNYYSSSTFITYNGRWDTTDNGNLWGGVTGVAHKADTDIKKVYLGSTQVRPTKKGPLCFTANSTGSTVRLRWHNGTSYFTFQKSTDGNTWSNYTLDTDVTLSIGDKVYFRTTSETDIDYGSINPYLRFFMSGSISASGDISTLINKNGTDTLSKKCFQSLFLQCTSLTSAPDLPFAVVPDSAYYDMFYGCTGLTIPPSLSSSTSLGASACGEMFRNCSNLIALPKIGATSLGNQCCYQMFTSCSKIKVSTTQTGEYQTPYRVPATGTGTVGSQSLSYMFRQTGGTYTGDATVNITYYTSNTVV